MKSKKYLLTIIVLLIMVLLFGKGLISGVGTSVTPEKYIEAFRAGEYEQCAKMTTGMDTDSDFAKEIEGTVTEELQTVYDSYLNGEIKYKEASEKLQNIKTASGGLFENRISECIQMTDDVHDMYRAVWLSEELLKDGKFKEGYDSVCKGIEYSEKLGIDIDWAVKQVLKNNINGFKYYLFTEYQNCIKQGEEGYKYIEETGGMMVKYTDDQDFSNFLSSLTALRDGRYSEQMGIAITTTMADAAKEAWDNEQGNSN